MLIFNRKQDLIRYLETNSTLKTTIGFVPTMGALHQGHLSLLKESIQQNTITVISIFVNPTQFNNPDDLEKYPRTLESDVEKIKTVSKNILIYAPDAADVYGEKTTSESFDFDGLEHQMEGQFRPGHFDGVGTIVKKLFEIVKPTNAYFGEKDFQQLLIVKKMVEKLNLSVSIVGCPIFRERNGLAMSSRNERLSEENRANAKIIYQTLLEANKLLHIKSLEEVILFVTQTINSTPNFELEYFQIANESTLLPIVNKNETEKSRAFIAVFVNNIRLIDTISLN